MGVKCGDNRGRILIRKIAEHHLIVLNDSDCLPTFEQINARGQTVKSGKPHISLTSFALYPNIASWEILPDMLFADHRVISIHINHPITKSFLIEAGIKRRMSRQQDS